MSQSMRQSDVEADLDLEVDPTELLKKSAQPNDLSLDTLVLLINAERLSFIQDGIKKEFAELRARQQDVRFFHKLLQAVNGGTNSKGEFDCTQNEEFKELLRQAALRGVVLPKDSQGQEKFRWTREERERLVDNIHMMVDDLNIENDMQLQVITRLTNERYECYQMARSIMKPLHEAKHRPAQAIKGS